MYIVLVKVKDMVLLGQLHKQGRNLVKVVDKVLVEVTESKEQLDPINSCRVLLPHDSFNLFRINFNSISANHKPKVLCISNLKFTFLNIYL